MASLPTLQPGAPREPRETLVNVEGYRWSIEDSFETAKNEFGLDHNETRSWHGWHRHVSLVMMAFAMMAAIRLQANQSTPKKTSQSRANAARAHPLVDPGDPSNSPTTQATTHQPSLYHCMVAMATRPPGRRSRGASQTQITTVMLGCVDGIPDMRF